MLEMQYTIETEKQIKKKKHLQLLYALVKDGKAKQKPNPEKPSNAWLKAKIIKIENGVIHIRVINSLNDIYPVYSLALIFKNDDKESVLAWGSSEKPLVNIAPKNLAILTFKPNKTYLQYIGG